MKFIYSDSRDAVDPNYDFVRDTTRVGRNISMADKYAHELMGRAPYDGLLVAMSTVCSVPGVEGARSRYKFAEEMRLRRVGVREFLRFNSPDHQDLMMMGDCGAFSYAHLDKPAFRPEAVVEFYTDGRFSHGCHPDHLIFDFDASNPGREAVSERVLSRYDITLSNAEEFLRLTHAEGMPFEPIGVVQGWSPQSMAQAALALERMGYRYLALGGLVKSRSTEIHLVLQAVRAVIKHDTKIHLLGFAKADEIHQFTGYGITSLDTTSPLLRAFKDAKRNYYLRGEDGSIEYHAAIRIPQAIENPRLMRSIKQGTFSCETLQRHERRALGALRGFDAGNTTLDTALDEISDYLDYFIKASEDDPTTRERMAVTARRNTDATLRAAPWKRCSCPICREIGVEVIVYRALNRHRRRGFHNLGVFHQHVRQITQAQA
jgi:queuine/archaeosine tRNA-ribosyltransferase